MNYFQNVANQKDHLKKGGGPLNGKYRYKIHQIEKYQY